MKKIIRSLKSWQFWFGAALLLSSAILYTIHYLLFHDLHHIEIYLLGDIAFAPIEVLIVTLILHQILHTREVSERNEKMNMVIGVFFSEVGRELLKKLNRKKRDLEEIKVFLKQKRDFLLRLFENSNLLEHESFTELLRGVFHLEEELCERCDMNSLPESDLKHLENDMNRVIGPLKTRWEHYLKHLKVNYPYLHSLASRTDPLDDNASVVVK